MFYKLKEEYMLRGWKFLPTGVINRNTRRFKFLSGKKFGVLEMCTGLLDSDSVLFSDEQRKIMEELRAEGYVEANENSSPINDVQKYKFYDNRFMHSVHWSITGRCNCRCRHCYMSAPQHKVEEFTHEECMKIIAQMAECGIQDVSLTGGEIMVRKDFWEIVDALTDADIRISALFSNGILLNEKFFAELERRNLRPDFQISFDGVNGWHDWLRGIDGAERLTLRALKLLQERNLKTTVAFGLHKGNCGVLRETVKTLGSLGVSFLRVAPIFAAGEAVGMTDKILSTEEIYEICLDYIPQYIEDGAPLPIILVGMFMGLNDKEYSIANEKMPESMNSDNYCLCGHVRNSMCINFDGLTLPCPAMGFEGNEQHELFFPHVFDMPFKELLGDGAYMNFINTRLGDYFKANPKCAACEYKNRCAGGCRGVALEENRDGNLFGIDRKTCLFFTGGYYDRVIELGKKLNLKRIGA